MFASSSEAAFVTSNDYLVTLLMNHGLLPVCVNLNFRMLQGRCYIT